MNWQVVARQFRQKRMQEFAAAFGITEHTRILDVGGTPLNWQFLRVRPQVTLLNMPRASEPVPPGFRWVSADGCSLPFCDRAFDIVFSNSVIEHVGDPGRQAAFATEVRRTGKSYWVQTPDRAAPVEPHLLMPFLHWMPRSLQTRIARRWTVWEALERPTPDRRDFYVEHFLRDIRLLSARELQSLFPDAEIRREQVAGIPKSLIALKRARA